MPAPQDRILLCIPRGGLNDTLCQIEVCHAYAEKFARTLVLDTSKSGLLGPFSDYFEFLEASPVVKPAVSPELLVALNAMPCDPPSLQGRIGQYKAVYQRSVGNLIDADTGTQLTFNFSKDHDAPLIVHDQCGGGGQSRNLLRKLKLAPNILTATNAALANLPPRFAGVHIRNSDYKTDYRPFLASIQTHLIGRDVLVCSDDANAIAYCKDTLRRSRVFTVTETPDFGSKPLHHHDAYASDDARWTATTNSIIDLLALSMATRIFTTNVTSDLSSGFSSLAKFLRTNKDVLRQLRQQTKPPLRARAGVVLSEFIWRWN